MSLEEAVKKAFENGFDTIEDYKIDGNFINLDCKKDASIYSARIIFNEKSFHIDSAYENEEIFKFAEKIKAFL